MKYIIVAATFPSGARWAFSHKGREFALVQIKGDEVRRASAWDSAQEAQRHLDAQLDVAPDLARLGPFTIEMVMEPS